MNKICKGVVFTAEAFEKETTDPDNLMVSTYEDLEGLAAVKSIGEKEPKDVVWEDITAVCREWYDVKKYDKAFCCSSGRSEDIFMGAA